MPRGGKRKGAGAPKGTIQKRTLEKEAVMRDFRQRVMRNCDQLFNAQYAKAVGSIMVFRVDEEKLGSGKTKRIHTLIADPEEIKKVLDAHEGGAGRVGESYYFVTEVSPDNKAIDSMLDRTFGKPQQSVEITDGTDEKLAVIRATIERIAREKNITYEEEFQNYLDHYAPQEIKEQLSSEMVN